MRPALSLLGLALALLAVAGLLHDAPAWMIRLDLIVGALALGALLLPATAPHAIQAVPVLLAAALVIPAAVGLRLGQSPAMCWATVSYGIGFLLLAVSLRPVPVQAIHPLGHQAV